MTARNLGRNQSSLFTHSTGKMVNKLPLRTVLAYCPESVTDHLASPS
jgi:hypothetical protein